MKRKDAQEETFFITKTGHFWLHLVSLRSNSGIREIECLSFVLSYFLNHFSCPFIPSWKFCTKYLWLICMPETPFPNNMDMVFIYSAFVKGDQTYFDIEGSGGVDGAQLYPLQKYTTISEYLDSLLEESKLCSS